MKLIVALALVGLKKLNNCTWMTNVFNNFVITGEDETVNTSINNVSKKITSQIDYYFLHTILLAIALLFLNNHCC